MWNSKEIDVFSNYLYVLEQRLTGAVKYNIDEDAR